MPRATPERAVDALDLEVAPGGHGHQLVLDHIAIRDRQDAVKIGHQFFLAVGFIKRQRGLVDITDADLADTSHDLLRVLPEVGLKVPDALGLEMVEVDFEPREILLPHGCGRELEKARGSAVRSV